MLSHTDIQHLKPAYPIATPKRVVPLANYNARFRKLDDDGAESADSCSSRLASRPNTPISNLSPSASPGSDASTAPAAPTASVGPGAPISTPQDHYLSFIEPAPVQPPSYCTLPPGGCPRYPVFHATHCESLPPYSPSVYKIGTVSRKIEWLSPYEPATSRSWKNLIVELNSTQLNFYAFPSHLEPHVTGFSPTEPAEFRNSMDSSDANYALINAYTTSDHDLQFFKYCERLGLLSDGDKQAGKRKLIRSYSLQYAKVGLATDYKKKTDVLRLRIESEQLLLHFGSTKEVIDWHLALSIGKDLSLDLQDRELPRYRTVPRRRRRRRTMIESGTDEPEFVRLRSHSDPGERLMGQFAKLRLKFKKDRSDSFTESAPQAEISSLAPEQAGSSVSGEHDDEPRRLSDLNCSDEEDEVAEESDSDNEDVDHKTTPPARNEYVKWRPPLEKTPSERRYYRSCLRCIKPLTHEDTWISKHLVKPTTVSPLNFHYMRAVKYNASAIESPFSNSSSSLASMSSNYSTLSLGGRKRSISLNKDNTFTVPDSALTKIPNHFVKEYIVGSHGLIPADP